jgi:quercetin dioxygenase-like cupin family protein
MHDVAITLTGRERPTATDGVSAAHLEEEAVVTPDGRLMNVPIVNEHPQKVRVDQIAADPTLSAASGWVDMAVQWVITRDTVGAERTVFGITTFPPGARHEVHRHPHAEEVEYLVEGAGLARVGDADVRMSPGDVVIAKAGEPHGFHNTSQTDRAVLIWCYGGAASLEEAGYVHEPDGQTNG